MRGNELAEAVLDLDEWSEEELAAFLDENEDWFEECEEIAEGDLHEGPHSPFVNGPTLHDVGAGRSGTNGRSQVNKCKCKSAGKYKQRCTCTGKSGKKTTRLVNMTKYYASGRKRKYMKKWRKIHGPHTPGGQ